MTKFKVLEKNQTFLNYVGILQDHSSNPTKKLLTFFSGYYIFISQSIGLIISAAFIFKYQSTDITASLSALKVCVAVAQCAGMFLGIKNKVNEINALQDELQKIDNKGISIFPKAVITYSSIIFK